MWNQNFKIDVCIVTKKSISDYRNAIKNAPINKVIVEKSEPLGLARMRAIQKVETEWFAFIDDDVQLTETWFNTISQFCQHDVGAIQGRMYIKGLGKEWDKDVNAFERSKGIQKLHLKERGYTHNTLIRTKLVKDWKPSRADLSAWEDYEITQHVLSKGYKWLVVPVEAYHHKSWKKIWTNAAWSMENWKKINARKSWLIHLIENVASIIRLLFDWFSFSMGWRARIYFSYTSLGEVYGLLKR